MALVLSLRKGHGFHVGTHHIEIASVLSPYEFSVRANDCPVVAISEEWREVLPGIKLMVGVPQSQEGKIVRVMIDAPGLKIVRDGSKDPDSDCEVCHGTHKMPVKVECSKCKGFGCSACLQGFVTEQHKCQECS